MYVHRSTSVSNSFLVKSNIRVPDLKYFSRCQENRKAAGQPVRKTSFPTKEHLRTATYNRNKKESLSL